MAIIVLCDNYPTPNAEYSSSFVHNRVKRYSEHYKCEVIKRSQGKDYIIDGIQVRVYSGGKEFRDIYQESSPEVVLIHFISRWMIQEIIPMIKVPLIVWVHGTEALGWYRRLFNYAISDFLKIDFYKRAYHNYLQLRSLRNTIKLSNSNQHKIHFVFVSRWMKTICETDTHIRCSHYSIIPNPIDTDTFAYKIKDPNDRKKILLIRSFETRKYANDIAIKAILKLSKKTYFEDLKITIIGKGKLFQKYTEKVSGFKNIVILEEFIHNNKIPELHAEHGIFLCPTRQDAQGVSMCEAMSSGLVPITSKVTAIPEFVTHLATGILANSHTSIVKAIDLMYNNIDEFMRISANSSDFIFGELSNDILIPKELDLIKSYLDSAKL